MMVTAQ